MVNAKQSELIMTMPPSTHQKDTINKSMLEMTTPSLDKQISQTFQKPKQ